MATRINIVLDATHKGENLAARAYVYRDDVLIEGMELFSEPAIIGAATGALTLGRAVQFFRAVNRTVEIEFSATDAATAAVAAKAGPKRIAEFYAAARFATTA